jgi:hypothetical protein
MKDFHDYAVDLMNSLGLPPDRWQVTVLRTHHARLLLNCSRQAGKSTTVAILARAQALYVPGTQVLLVSRSFRQAAELFRRITDFHARLKSPLRAGENAQELTFSHGSRIVCLPCKEETIRGYSDIDLLIIDEAARVPDDLYCAVRPMLAVSAGRARGAGRLERGHVDLEAELHIRLGEIPRRQQRVELTGQVRRPGIVERMPVPVFAQWRVEVVQERHGAIPRSLN